MAFSQPLSESTLQKGQIVVVCQLCENDSKLKCKCLDCGLMMCQRCRDKVHPKFPSAEDHTIINVKDISTHQRGSEPKLDLSILTKLKCDVHTGKTCCMYCKSCQELVCQTCIATTHNTHNFSEINYEYDTKLENVDKMLTKIKTDIHNLTRRKLQLKFIKLTAKANYVKVKQEIFDHSEALVNAIKEQTNKLIKELDQKYEVFTKDTDNNEKDLQVQTGQIEERSQRLYQLLQPINAKYLFTNFDSFFKSTETNIPLVVTSFHGVPKFTQGDRTKISLILGKLEDVTVQYNTEPNVDKKFQTELKNITNVISCSPDSFWISDYHSGRFQKIKLHKDILRVTSNMRINVLDTALLPSGDLLLSIGGSSRLKLVPSGSSDIQDSVYSVSPLQSTAVHVIFDGKVIAGGKKRQSVFPVKGHTKVIVMDHTGNQVKNFQYDGHAEPLFTYPYRITSDRNGNIAILDLVSEDQKGRVVILGQEGEVRSIYTGHPYVNKEDNPFRPTGITTTPLDNFVVTDTGNHTLHVLSSEGEIITHYDTRKIGILLPSSLSFSSTGQLYIACANYTKSKDKAKLFRVNNLLC